MTSKRLLNLGAALLSAAALNAHAGRPFTTEDAGYLERGACEWENTASRVSAGGASGRLLYTQAGCGVAEGVQINLGAGRASADGERDTVLALSGKFGLMNGGEAGPSLTLAWGANWLRAAGSSNELATLAANLVLSAPLADGWTGHANLGALHLKPESRTRTTWALGLERNLRDGTDVGAELYQEGLGKPWMAVGLRQRLAENWTAYASAGSRRGEDGGPRERLLTVGFKLEF